MCQERFEKLWSSFDCGENIALTIIGGGAKGFGEGVVEAITDPHVILDAIGMIPLLGEVADGLNALLYYLEGDYVNAGISVAAMVPGVGILATTGRTAGKAFKAIGNAEDLRHVHGHRHFDTLQLDPKDWSIEKNRAWIQEGIDNKQMFYLASDPSVRKTLWDESKGIFEPRVFWDELQQLMESGYRQQGSWMVPPR
jgi:hypothetical protein